MRRGLLVPALFAVVITSHATGLNDSIHESPSQTETMVRAVFKRSAWLDVSRVKIHLNNRGSLDNNAPGGSGGAFWPDTTDPYGNVLLYDFGPWIVGKLNGIPKMGLSQWGTSYSPGPVISGQPALTAQPADSLRYRLYKITKGDDAASNPDYRDWPSDLGAPLDTQGKPRLYGEQTVWTIFNNLDTLAPSNWWRSHMPLPGLPVEIQETVYEQRVDDSNAVLGNVAFIEWTIVNTGDVPIESTYVSLWADVDFNGTTDNRPAVDTVNQLGYCWQFYNTAYHTLPRAVGFVWLYGPSVPSVGSQAIFRGNHRPDYKNLPLSSFWGIQDDSFQDSSFNGPSYSMGTAWNIARGFDKAGNPIVDSATHQITKFPYNGDPVKGSGWLCPFSSGGAGFNMFSGPFTMAPHDTQWVMAAVIPVNSSDHLECVRLLREHAATLRAMSYGTLVVSSVPGGDPALLPTRTAMEQNYPNPFNPKTVIKYTIGGNGGEGEGNNHVSLVVYDVLGRQVAILVNERKAPGEYEVTFDGSGLSSGVYFCRLEAGVFVGLKELLLVR